MALTGVCFVATQPGNTSETLTARLLRYTERKYPTQHQQAFHLDHRLFSDTSSQLPGADAAQRTFNHILITSHDDTRAYTRATAPGNASQGATLTMPVASVEPLVGLLHTKMQALWFPRHALHVTDGVSITLMDGRVRLSFGDLKISRGFAGVGTSRGALIEVSVRQSIDSTQNGNVDHSLLFQDILKRLLPNIDIDFGEVKFVTGPTQVLSESEENAPDYNLAKLYMDLMRGLR